MKASKDSYNVRDIENYYHDYVDKESPLVGAKHIDMDVSDKRHDIPVYNQHIEWLGGAVALLRRLQMYRLPGKANEDVESIHLSCMI